MPSRKELYIVGVLILLGISAAIVSAAYYIGRQQAVLGELIKSQNERIAAAEQKISDSKKAESAVVKQEDTRSSDLARALAQFAQAKQQPVDLDELARRIQERMGTQATVQTPASSLPNAPSAVTLDSKKLSDYLYDCDAAKSGFASCQIGLANKDAIIAEKDKQLAADGEKIDALTKEKNAAVKASKGGGFFARLKSNSRFLLYGGMAATAALCGSGHCK